MTDSDRRLSGVAFRPADVLLSRFPDVYGGSAPERAASLARALTSSPPWSALRDRARVVLRTDAAPRLAVVGRFDDSDAPALQALGWQVGDALSRLRPVPHGEVERACAVLADRLLVQLGEERLRSCRVVGVPRGGLIVAALLAYTLDLTHEQLSAAPSDDRMTIVVDDCMLSGARIRRWLRGHAGPPVVLAHLHSHPALRTAVERHDDVHACIAAADLHDHAPERHGARYEEWKHAWEVRSPDDFWTGHPDHVAYPWNEPDTLFWNPLRGTSEPGWHVVPPDWCVKNRASARSEDIQACASPHVPADVVWALLDGVVVLVDTSRGTSLELSGTGVDFWRELVAVGDVTVAAEALAATYDVDRSVVLADLERFVAQLREGGWWGPGSRG